MQKPAACGHGIRIAPALALEPDAARDQCVGVHRLWLGVGLVGLRV